MAACASCGSMRTRAVKGGVLERILAMLLSRQVFVCSRCGWRGRGRRPAGVVKNTQRHARGSRVSDSLADTRTDAQIDLTSLDRAMEIDVIQKPKREQ